LYIRDLQFDNEPDRSAAINMASKKDMTNPLLVGTAIRAQMQHEIPTDLPLEREFRENTDRAPTQHCPTARAALQGPAPSRDEWTKLIQFLTRAGKESTDFKNEFVLLSDCLGASALIDELAHPKPPGCTDSCEAGPFYTEDAPEVPSGVSLAKSGTTGEAMFFSGSVVNTKGQGIRGAKIDVWQADGDGVYDVQYPDRDEPNDRGKIVAESDGTFCYRAILPTAYPIPSDGPAGDFLRKMGRHPHRAAHIHFTLKAPGYDDLTTALYPSHSPFLGTDPVFATKKSLICQLTEEHDPQEWAKMGFKEGEVKNGRVWVWKYRFVLPSVQEVQQMKQQQNSGRAKL